MNTASISPIAHSFSAIAAGFITMAALVMITTIALARVAPAFVSEGQKPRLPYMLFNLLFSSAYAVLGGWVTARLLPLWRNPLTHTMILAIVVLIMGALSAVQLRGRQPVGYQILLTVITPVSVLLGGLLRMHQLGYTW